MSFRPAAVGTIEARPTRDLAGWDAFAGQCEASFRCARRAAHGWQFEHHLIHRLHHLDLWLTTTDGRRQVGQCAVGVGRRRRVFADALQLLPEDGHRWAAAMAAVLGRLSSGTYVYGSDWNPEPPRQADLALIPGVTVTAVQPTDLAIVDLTRWATADDYLQSVSTNARRNARKAAHHWPGLAVGPPAGGRDTWTALRLRRAMYRRKGVGRSVLAMVARSAARTLCTRGYARPIHATAGRAVLATHVGIEFGRRWYYLEGASAADDHGAAWHLMLAVIGRAHADGCESFVMGSDDGSQAGSPHWEGLRRSRQQCGATYVPTSTVVFDYRNPAAPPVTPVAAGATPARPPVAAAIQAGRR